MLQILHTEILPPKCAGGVTHTACVLCCWSARRPSKHLGVLCWAVEFSPKRKEGKILKHLGSQLEHIPSRDGGTVEKPRLTVALPRGRTGFRHKTYGELAMAAGWGQPKKKVTIRINKVTVESSCLHQPYYLLYLPAPASCPMALQVKSNHHLPNSRLEIGRVLQK